MAGEERQVVCTEAAPAAIGPYSQAVVLGGLVYTSGQIPLDPASGELVGGDVGDQTRQVMRNLGAVLEAAGSSLDLVLKTTCYLQDMSEFPRFNEAYAEHFTSEPPARSTVGVAALPKGALVEVEAVAVCRSGG